MQLKGSCYRHLPHGGMMFFTAITKDASTYGVGEKPRTDRYRTKDVVMVAVCATLQ